MNNAWTSVAFRVPCAARANRSKPLLELFNGYSRRYTSRWMDPGSRETRVWETPRSKIDEPSQSRLLSSTALLYARQRRPPPPRNYQSRIDIQSRDGHANLQFPLRAASHTEGLDPQEIEHLSWRDYDPAGGMPLPDGELSRQEINEVFGPEEVDLDTGNYILSVMHWRRLSGALIDQELGFPKDSGVSREQAARGLQYLRQYMPDVDEEANGQQWVEEENERLSEEMQERAIKLKLYKRDESHSAQEEELPEQQPPTPESDQGTEEGRMRNQESVLETHRREKEAQHAREDAEKQAAAEKAELAALHSRRGPLELGAGVQPDTQMILYGPGGVSITAPKSKAWLQPVERKPWVKYYEEQAQIIKDHTIPQLSLIRRLGPSFLVLLALLWLSAFLSDNYTPPPTEARVWPDSPPSVATLFTLTATLGLFFIANRFPPFWRTYSKFFTLVPAYPYAASILGSTFRHDTLAHLATNLASLWLMGLLLHEDVGRGTFLAIFLASGATGAFTSLSYLVLRQNWAAYVFGCSGAVLGVASAVCTLRPNARVTVGGYEIPVAAWMYLALWGGLELVAARRMPRLDVDHAGHIGGLVGGVACAAWLRWKARRSVEEREGRNKGDVQMVRVDGG